MNAFQRQSHTAFSPVPRVLIVAPRAAAHAALGAEMMRRGALVAFAETVAEAAALARRHPHEIILVAAREGANETALLLTLLRAEALGSPRILFLIEPDRAEAHGLGAVAADAVVAADLDPGLIANAAGIAAPEAPVHLPAVAVAARWTVLSLPAPFAADALPADIRQLNDRGGVPDAVILREPAGLALMSAWLSPAAAAVVPVIDASGRLGARADASLPIPGPHAVSAVMERLAPLVARMRELPESFFRNPEPRAHLLARLAVRDRHTPVRRDPSSRATVRHEDEEAVADLPRTAETLARTGHLRKKLFDRLHVCPSCTSARLSVREECAHCRSPDIAEEPVIHHLRCAYQGPERDFRQGRDLVCPKCRLHLEHFGVDYDKPTSLFLCHDCSHTTGEPSIGFVCLDCETAHDSSKMRTRDVFEYHLTDEGRRAAFLPHVDDGPSPDGPGTDARERLRWFVARQRAAGLPHAGLMIRLDATGESEASLGPRRWKDAQALFATILHEVFSDDTQIIEAGKTFLVLVAGTARDTVDASLPLIRAEVETAIAVPTGARYDVLGPDQLALFL